MFIPQHAEALHPWEQDHQGMIMDYCNNDIDHINLMDMVECDAQNGFEKIMLPSDKVGALDSILSGESALCSGNTQLDIDNNSSDLTNVNWMQYQEWAELLKQQQYQIDPTDMGNTNTNLLVNPQTALPIPEQHIPVCKANGPFTIGAVHLDENIHVTNDIVKCEHNPAILAQPQIQFITVTSNNTASKSVYSFVNPASVSSQIVTSSSPSSPSLNSPTLVQQLQSGIPSQMKNAQQVALTLTAKPEKVYPKPVYSYSCLIAMALNNSHNGNLPVSEIYTFMIDNFPYFKTAPDGWKNSVRHNLSLNKCFAKVDNPKLNGSTTRKGCLWALNPAKKAKMEEEIAKWRKKEPEAIRCSMAKPENLDLIEQGRAGSHHNNIKLHQLQSESSLASSPVAVTDYQKSSTFLLSDLKDYTCVDSRLIDASDPILSDLAEQFLFA